jgi:hypothetical protein
MDIDVSILDKFGGEPIRRRAQFPATRIAAGHWKTVLMTAIAANGNKLGGIDQMKVTFKSLIAGTTALAGVSLAGAAFAQDTVTIGITQNNVGVDSYQTTYEKAFIAAAEANENVEAVVLDAGGDVARQIAQMEDLIQQEVDAIIIWPTNGEAVIPAVRKAHQADIPVSSQTPTSPKRL